MGAIITKSRPLHQSLSHSLVTQYGSQRTHNACQFALGTHYGVNVLVCPWSFVAQSITAAMVEPHMLKLAIKVAL